MGRTNRKQKSEDRLQKNYKKKFRKRELRRQEKLFHFQDIQKGNADEFFGEEIEYEIEFENYTLDEE
jgi:hypothetical protein